MTENPNGSRTYARWTENHPQDFIIGSFTAGVRTRRNVENFLSCYISQVEPKTVPEALQYSDWIVAMQEELNQFESNEVWELVDRPPKGTKVIGTRWVFKNKLDEDCTIVRNKA